MLLFGISARVFSARAWLVAGIALIFSQAVPVQAIAEDESAAEPMARCSYLGTGYFQLPGSQTCLSIGGQITMEASYSTPGTSLYAETLYLGGIPFVIYDSLTAEASPPRVRLESLLSFTAVSGTDHGPLVSHVALKSDRVGDNENFYLDQGFISLAGFTVGRRKSFFDFSPGFTFTEGYSSNKITNLGAYTRKIGEKARVTVSLEGNRDRRTEEGVWALRGTHSLPDLVVSARLDDRWGAAQVSAAVQQISDDRETVCCGVPESRVGWAVSAGLEYRMKVGRWYGRILLGGAYAEGAMSYLGTLPYTSDYLISVDGQIVRTRGYSLIASYEHVWRDNLKSMITASMMSTSQTTDTLSWNPTGVLVSLGSEYMPVPGLQIGLEGSYYLDVGRATYLGAEGEVLSGQFGRVKAYARRRF